MPNSDELCRDSYEEFMSSFHVPSPSGMLNICALALHWLDLADSGGWDGRCIINWFTMSGVVDIDYDSPGSEELFK